MHQMDGGKGTARWAAVLRGVALGYGSHGCSLFAELEILPVEQAYAPCQDAGEPSVVGTRAE